MSQAAAVAMVAENLGTLGVVLKRYRDHADEQHQEDTDTTPKQVRKVKRRSSSHESVYLSFISEAILRALSRERKRLETIAEEMDRVEAHRSQVEPASPADLAWLRNQIEGLGHRGD